MHCPSRTSQVLLAMLLLAVRAAAVTATPEELALCRHWTEAVLDPRAAAAQPGLELVSEDTADGVTRGRSWRGTPFQIGARTYTHGLAFNATKRLRVRLGQPAARFRADVGLEHNDDTRRGAAMGHGSVTFHVFVEGREVFASPVRRLADEPLTVELPLHGAREFELRVGDGGDGRGWDQALWGGALIELSDGTPVRLQDLPWLGGRDANPHLVSFQLAGAPSRPLLDRWPRTVTGTALDRSEAPSTRRTVQYRDPASGLEVRVELEQFRDFPAVEWVAHLHNAGATPTPPLERIQALDTALALPTAGPPTLHWAKGAVASFDDFAPQTHALKAGTTLHLQPGGGRSSSQAMPFFNLEGAGGGAVLALGWSGEWAADFDGEVHGTVPLRVGQARTRLVLQPGERIRTPRVLLLFYQGDRWRGQNLLRRFLLAHHRPTRAGQPLVAPITCGNWGGTRAEVHLDNIQRIVGERLPVDYYWIDAEWFGRGGWPENVGDWTVKADLYPDGFKPLSDRLRAHGRELMLWFEPERVFKGTPWHREHRAWLFDTGGSSLLFNLGDPDARAFLTQFLSDRITAFGLGCYRQDFNMDPLPFWQAADAPDRQGMSELRHIEGLYAFWDGLRARHPDLLIDNCASGGRRLDLETVGRATPFWRTDGPRDPIAHQCHTYGLLAWVPLSATSQDRAGDDYEFRSSMCSALCLNWWVAGDVPAERIPDDFPFDWARRTLAQYLELRPFYYGDYYPLTGYSQAGDVWQAYELARPEHGDGLVVALRRPASPYESAAFPLRGADPAAEYEVTDLDTGARQTVRGADLQRAGLTVAIPHAPGSALVLYRQRAP